VVLQLSEMTMKLHIDELDTRLILGARELMSHAIRVHGKLQDLFEGYTMEEIDTAVANALGLHFCMADNGIDLDLEETFLHGIAHCRLFLSVIRANFDNMTCESDEPGGS
jgi:hypothetical protein